MAKKEDLFAEFEDWLMNGPAGKWPQTWEPEKNLTREQLSIVQNNAALLLDRDGWKRRVDAFEAAIRSLETEDAQVEKRAIYQIRFDNFYFSTQDNDFSQLHFPCAADFRRVKFCDGNISFAGARFEKGRANFSGMSCGTGVVDFSQAQFCGRGANFSNSKFGHGKVDFNLAQFEKGDVDFSDTIFMDGDVSFAEARFEEGDVRFNRAHFGNGETSFIETEFGKGRVDFSDACFGDGVVYLSAMMLSSSSFLASDMVVTGSLYVNADFPSYADFQRLKVEKSVSFSGCKFEQVPDFRNAKFDRPPDVANMDVPRPKLKKDRFWHFSRATDGLDAPRLRKLKAMALDASDHERDGYFFAREMQAKRGGETKSFSGLLFNTLYDWFSGYGQSFVKPFWWWGANLASFCLYYVYIIGPAAEPLTRLYFAFHHSLRNSLPLLGGLVRYAIKPEDWQDRYGVIYKQLEVAKVDIAWLVNLGIIQSIIGGILLFLFLLALRNRFRLK